MKPFVPFYRRPLPVFNAPALNNALEAAQSGLLYDVRGRGGYFIQRPQISVATAQVAQQQVAFNGLGGIPVGSYGSQGLTDPNARGAARNI